MRLEDGRFGVVARYNRTNPFRPTIVVSFGADGAPLPRGAIEGPVTAGEAPHLRMHTFDGEDLSFLYEPPTDSTAAPHPRHRPFATLLDALYP